MRSTSEAGVRLSVMLDSYRQRTINGSDKTTSPFARLGMVLADTNEKNNRLMIASFCFETFAIFDLRSTSGQRLAFSLSESIICHSSVRHLIQNCTLRFA